MKISDIYNLTRPKKGRRHFLVPPIKNHFLITTIFRFPKDISYCSKLEKKGENPDYLGDQPVLFYQKSFPHARDKFQIFKIFQTMVCPLWFLSIFSDRIFNHFF